MHCYQSGEGYLFTTSEPVDGIDITSISRFKKNECDGSFGEIDRTGDDNLHVTYPMRMVDWCLNMKSLWWVFFHESRS